MKTIIECHKSIDRVRGRPIYEEVNGRWYIEVLIDLGNTHVNVVVLNNNGGGSHKSKREAANAAASFVERINITEKNK